MSTDAQPTKPRIDIVIRPVNADDRLEWQELWRQYLEFYKSTVSDEVYASTFSRLLSDPSFVGLVAEQTIGDDLSLAGASVSASDAAAAVAAGSSASASVSAATGAATGAAGDDSAPGDIISAAAAAADKESSRDRKKKNTRLVGLAHIIYHYNCWSIEPRAYLQDLFTLASVRGCGVGRALIESAAQLAKEKKCEQLYWLTDVNNTQARVLYDKVASVTTFIKYKKSLQ